MEKQLEFLLRQAFMEKASDVHITVGLPPVFRIHGKLQHQGEIVCTKEDTIHMAKTMMTEMEWSTFQKKGEVDFSYELKDVSRFRVNIFKHNSGVSLAIRLISTSIPSLDQLGLPPVLKKITMKPQGLVLVTGPTGSGKSTTLAAMIDYINSTESKHIITLEDPIEYIHSHKSSVIDQREMGRDTTSFGAGLRASLRQDPDIILVGEMRDLETISTAITAAETGHLVFGTLHTSSAPATIQRIIDVFPTEQQAQVRYQLSTVLQAVISQRLFPALDGMGRVAATEILVNNYAIGNLIRSEKLHQIPSMMQTSRDQGMHTLQMNIKDLLQRGMVNRETVKEYIEENSYGSI